MMRYRVKCVSDDPRDAGVELWKDITEEFDRIKKAGEIPVFIGGEPEIIQWMQRFALPNTRVTTFEAGPAQFDF